MAAYTFRVILGVVVRVHMKTIVPYVDCFMWSKSKWVLFRTICPNTFFIWFHVLCFLMCSFGSIFDSFVYSYFPFYIGNPPSFWCSHIHMFVNYGINLFWSLCFLFDCFLCSSSFFQQDKKQISICFVLFFIFFADIL